MSNSDEEILVGLYFELSNKLPEKNKHLRLQNHCYLRIANDMACGEKWNNKVEKPFYKNASKELLEESVIYLQKMLDKEWLILHYNEISISNRVKTK